MQILPIPDLEPDIGLIVPADVICIAASARVTGAGPSRSVAALRQGAQLVLRQLAGVHPRTELVARRLHLGGGHGDKAAKTDRTDVQFDAIVRVPLDPDLGLWERAELAARLVEALAAASNDLNKHKPAIKLGWRNPKARVLDVEAHRPKLTSLWNARVRALLDGLDGVHMSGVWEAPVEVLQAPVSLDRVRLTLGSGQRAR
ncbi:MAG: hypothetical protein ACOC1F_00755 [Myxococcota bacterium]